MTQDNTDDAHSPARLGDHHLCPILVELGPEFLALQRHLGVIIDIVILRGRRPEPGASTEGEAREAGKQAGVT